MFAPFPSLFAALAWAAPPAWQWPEGHSRVYAIEVYVRLPEPLPLSAGPDAVDATADLAQFQLQIVTSCESGVVDPVHLTLVCAIRDLSLVGKTRPGNDADIGPVLAAVDKRLTGALTTVVVDRSGRVISLGLADLSKKERKKPGSVSSMLWLLERALLGLDLSLPEDGAAGWGESGSGLLSYVPAGDSHGVTRIFHQITPTGAGLDIASVGRGVVQANAQSSSRGPAGALSVSLALQGTARFDPAEGALTSRSWVTLGRATPLAMSDDTLPDPTYAWSGWLRELGTGESFAVGPTGVWTEAFAPGQAWQSLQAAQPALDALLDGTTPLVGPP